MKNAEARAVIAAICIFSAGCAVTTKPLSTEEIMSRIASDRVEMFKDQEGIDASIAIEEAMARTLKYNLDHRIKIMEDALALRQSEAMAYDMLPRLITSAGYNQRDSYNASSSINYATGQPSLVPSYSEDRGRFTADLTLTWSILDFGVSYLQAKQQAERNHIMKERRRKVVHTIIQQVRQAYWQALGAQQMEGRFEPLLVEVKRALHDIECIEGEKLRPPLETLNYRKVLLEIMKQLETFRDELAQAKPRLAALMNLPPGKPFVLVSPERMDVPALCDTLSAMEEKALVTRPELLEADYNERISATEVHKTILRMLPGLELNVGGHLDNNSLLVNEKWIEGSARMTWNLLNLLSGPNQYKVAKGQVELAKAQRMALSMAILTQVDVAYQNFNSQVRQYELAGALQDVDTRIYQQTKNASTSGAQSRLNEIRSATAALMAEYRSYQNYASLQNAYGQIHASLGVDPLPQTIGSHDITVLSGAIRKQLDQGCKAPVKSAEKAVCTAPSTPVNHSTAPRASQPVEPRLSLPVQEMTPGALPVAVPVPSVSADIGKLKVCKSMLLEVRFAPGKADLKSDYRAELEKIAKYMKENPSALTIIEGHTDNTSFKGGNLVLSQLRADSVRDYIVKNFGIASSSFITRGYGADKPVAENSSEAGREKNRRIVALLTCKE